MQKIAEFIFFHLLIFFFSECEQNVNFLVFPVCSISNSVSKERKPRVAITDSWFFSVCLLGMVHNRALQPNIVSFINGIYFSLFLPFISPTNCFLQLRKFATVQKNKIHSKTIMKSWGLWYGNLTRSWWTAVIRPALNNNFSFIYKRMPCLPLHLQHTSVLVYAFSWNQK